MPDGASTGLRRSARDRSYEETWPVSVYCNRADLHYPASYLSWNPWNALWSPLQALRYQDRG